MALPFALVGAGIESLERLQHLLRLHAEEDTMDGLEFQGAVVVVHHFHQRVPGGQAGPLALRRDLFQVLIALFGSGQGVVAVAHRKQQWRHAAHAVLLLHLHIGAQALQRVRHAVHLLAGQLPALQVAAALLQVKVIEPLHLAAAGRQGFDDGSLRVVDQQHDVGQFDGCVLPDPNTGRDAGEHGALRGADQRAAAGGKVVLLQVHHANQAMAHLAVRLGALDIDERILERPEHAAVQILFHGRVNVRNVFVHVGVVQLRLRQNQPQSRGRVAHGVLHRLPVFRLRGKLVTGHHGPLGHVRAIRQQDIRRVKA